MSDTQNPTVVLVHGAFADASSWNGVIERLPADDDVRLVETDVHARYFGAELGEHSLLPGGDARIAPTRFEDWLNRSVPA